MKYLIVGLGNIGAKYRDTRHNVGFMVVDYLAQKFEANFETLRHADKAEFKYKSRQIHLIKPTTYMNLSGKAVRYWLQELKIEKANLLVIVDDLALDLGKLRMRPKGSAGGHNGLSNIQEQIGGSDYARLRFGIGDDFPKGKQADYVLSPFASNEQSELELTIPRAADMVLSFASIGIAQTMTNFND